MSEEGRGARVVFSRGVAVLKEAEPVPAGALPPRASIISPGTELKRLATTRTGTDRAAGYMTLSAPYGTGAALLAPVPHGAAIDRDDRRALPVPAGVSVQQVAVARFQLMAALGLRRWRDLLHAAGEATIVGSGPVATGCALELRCQGVERIRVLTSRAQPVLAALPGVEVTRSVEPGSADFVIDCTGKAAMASEIVADGGLLGLLGTPDEDEELLAAALHRRSIVVAGMHELAGWQADTRSRVFADVLRWLVTPAGWFPADTWCWILPGEQAPEIYARLGGPERPREPFLILEWAP